MTRPLAKGRTNLLPQILTRPMSDETPLDLTPEGAKALEETLAERRKFGISDTPVVIGPLAVGYMDNEQRKAHVLPFSPAETQQQHVDVAFQAPSAGQRLFHLQAIESTQAAAVAEDLAFRFYGCKLAELTTEDRVTVQYTAVGAVRALSECWRREARRASVAAIERAMKEEMGPVFARMPWEARRKLAEIAETEARVASIGVLTGASRMAPGTYLRIVTGEQR
jgi:hypothetical protein